MGLHAMEVSGQHQVWGLLLSHTTLPWRARIPTLPMPCAARRALTLERMVASCEAVITE